MLLAGQLRAQQNLVAKPDFGTAVSSAKAPASFPTDLTLDNDGNDASSQAAYAVLPDPHALSSGFGSSYAHTVGTSAGALLAVDGPASATTAVWQQTLAGQPGRTYTFSYWQRNLTDARNARL